MKDRDQLLLALGTLEEDKKAQLEGIFTKLEKYAKDNPAAKRTKLIPLIKEQDVIQSIVAHIESNKSITIVEFKITDKEKVKELKQFQLSDITGARKKQIIDLHDY